VTGLPQTEATVLDEDQYSVWPADQNLPAGWHTEGTTGSKQERLDHIERVWTDLRPRSLRTTHAAS
jgi:MbtH protein